MKGRRPPAGAIFGWPMVLGLVSLMGLVIGLLGDHWVDIAAGVAVAAPVLVIGWSLLRAHRGGWDR